MDRDTRVNDILDEDNERRGVHPRVPRDVEVFNPEEFDGHPWSEADDLNKPITHDVDVIDGKVDLEEDLDVNYILAERGITRIPRDVEIFDPEELAANFAREEYPASDGRYVEAIDEPRTEEEIDLGGDLRVNDILDGRGVTRVPRDVELFDPAEFQ